MKKKKAVSQRYPNLKVEPTHVGFENQKVESIGVRLNLTREISRSIS